ncbi:MAG: hypothetical protein M3Y22_00985 [Pseudomonadota bacterium]|nr:hypothetical protein [Pseudomonadota bacterium]
MIDRHLAATRRLSIAGAIIAGLALCALLLGSTRAAVAATVIVVVLRIWSLEVALAAIARTREIIR